MAAKSSSDRYGAVAVTLHWLTALLILALFVLGFQAQEAEPAAKAGLLQIHVPLGVLVLLLTLIRIAWWLFADGKPVPVPMPAWQRRVSQIVHFFFYVAILGMAASGIGMLVLSGAGPAIFEGPAESLPDFWDYKPRIPHAIGARALIALLVLHMGAALYHQFGRKDGALRRIWY